MAPCDAQAEIERLKAELANRDNDLLSMRLQRDQLHSKLERLPADWTIDSSLDTWFPLTATELESLKHELAELRRPVEAKEIAEIQERAEETAAHCGVTSIGGQQAVEDRIVLLRALAESQRENARLQVELKDLRSER